MDRPKHSGLGVASFCISMLTGAVVFAMIVIATMMELASPDGMDEESPAAIVLGLVLLAGILVAFISAVLGFVSCFQADRTKVFGILGAVIGGTITFATLALIAVGLAMP